MKFNFLTNIYIVNTVFGVKLLFYSFLGCINFERIFDGISELDQEASEKYCEFV